MVLKGNLEINVIYNELLNYCKHANSNYIVLYNFYYSCMPWTVKTQIYLFIWDTLQKMRKVNTSYTISDELDFKYVVETHYTV